MISEKIDIFLEVGQELTFSEVAKKRYTTQPTISRQISDLESAWGIRLFDRSNKGLRLTPEGAIMLKCCRRLDAQLEAELFKARNFMTSVRDKLRLGFLMDMNVDKLFMPRINTFADTYKELDISLTFGSFGDLRKGLKDQKLDIIFTYTFELANIKEDVVVDDVWVCTPCLAISDKHPLYGQKNLKTGDLSGETFFIPEESDSPGRERDLLHILDVNKVEGVQMRFAPNEESVLLQIRLGRGVMITHQDAQQIEQYGLQVIPLEKKGNLGTMSIVAVWGKDNLNPFLSVFMRALSDPEVV